MTVKKTLRVIWFAAILAMLAIATALPTFAYCHSCGW
jgi:hypothetical protein